MLVRDANMNNRSVSRIASCAGQKFFPNASIHVDQTDLDYSLHAASADSASELIKPFFAQAESRMRPYIRAGQVKGFMGDTTRWYPIAVLDDAVTH
jgi:hypothetical protein